MAKCWSVNGLIRVIAETQRDQAFIVHILNRHEIRAAGSPRKVVLNTVTAVASGTGVRHANSPRRKLVWIKRMNRGVQRYDEIERREHSIELHDQDSVATLLKVKNGSCVGRANCVGTAGSVRNASSRPIWRGEQHQRKGGKGQGSGVHGYPP